MRSKSGSQVPKSQIFHIIVFYEFHRTRTPKLKVTGVLLGMSHIDQYMMDDLCFEIVLIQSGIEAAPQSLRKANFDWLNFSITTVALSNDYGKSRKIMPLTRI